MAGRLRDRRSRTPTSSTDGVRPLALACRVVHHLEIKRQMTASDIAAVHALLDAVARADGRQALADHQWLDLAHGGREGFAGLVAWEPSHPHPVAYAQVSRGNGSWALDLVVDPHHRYEMTTIGPELLGAAVGVIASEGGGPVHWWVFEPTGLHEQLAHDAGLLPGRRLHQMRRSLPTGFAFDLPTRPFVPGQDEAAWLAVNNLAFAAHPEQGGWDLPMLLAREAEPWFDPAGFLLHERDGHLIGFCWTKVHAGEQPVLGEIYVIAVDPRFHGTGLGRALTLAGLASLTERGVRTGMLYVDAENVPAVRLYEQLGFTVHHTDWSFVGTVKPT